MAAPILPWEVITENVINVSEVLNDLLDMETPKDVSWVVKDEEGNIIEVNVPNVAKLFEIYGKKYLGAYDKDPVTKPDGTALQLGDLYFNTTDNKMYVYTSNGWEIAVGYVDAISKSQTFVGDGQTTVFTVDGGYNVGNIQVYLNGVNVTNDVTADDFTTIKFKEAPAENDEIYVMALGSFSVADTYDKDTIDRLVVNKTTTVNPDNANSIVLENGMYLLVDTTDGEVNLKLPSNPADGARLCVHDYAGNFDVNNVHLEGNGKQINDSDGIVLDIKYGKFELVYFADIDKWLISQ